MTYEEKLKTIIQRQVEGGYIDWGEKYLDVNFTPPVTLRGEYIESPLHNEEVSDQDHILAILLDTEGMKACYEGQNRCAICERNKLFGKNKNSSIHGCLGMSLKEYGYCILDAWNSGEGNNWKATIDTAHSLLGQ